MSRPLLLDLFCGAGGAAMGYSRVGFDVVGVDIKPQPHYGGMLCGSSFGLPIWRHRYFETVPPTMSPPCRHDLVPHPLNPYNTKSKRRDGITGVTDPRWKSAMGIDWMTGDEIAEAIPPAYTQYIGEQLMEHLARVA